MNPSAALTALSRRTLLLGAAAAPILGFQAARAAEAFFPGCTAAPRGSRRQVGRLSAFHVPMADGEKIAVDLVLPADIAPGERLPAVLSMTRYWRAAAGTGPGGIAEWLVPNGYAVVVGDSRGTGASSGLWTHHRSRAETGDFAPLIEWIAQQPWCNGQVIGFGNSYAGNTADWMAERRPKSLVAIVPRFPDYDPYADLYFPGGVPNAYMGTTWGKMVKDLDLNQRVEKDGSPTRGVRPVDADTSGSGLSSVIARRAEMPSVYEGLKQVTFRDDRPTGWAGESMDDWGIHTHAKQLEAGKTPMQTWAGWMDAGTANGAIHRFMTLANPQRVYIGAWSHGGFNDADPFLPSTEAPNPSFAIQQGEDLCFMEQCLAGKSPPVGDRRLSYFTMGEGRWKTTKVWPPVESKLQPFGFDASGRLTRGASARSGVDEYVVDFGASTGVTNRWATNNGAGDVVYPDRAEADRRLLCYTTPPLDADLEITGHPIVELNLASTHTDGAVFIYLEDVGPNGVVRYVTEGQLRLLHRKVSNKQPPYWTAGPYHSFCQSDALPMRPGESAQVTFSLMPVSVLLRAGHRLRVALAGADADTFARVPPTGDPVFTVHRGGKTGSRILLPVIDRG